MARSRSRSSIDTLPNLKLRGMLSYDGGAQHVNGFAARKERALKSMEENARTFETMKAAGLNTEIFSGGGTGTYSVQHLTPGFTDVQVGSYIFMDMQYLAIGSEDGSPVVQRLRAVVDRVGDGSQQPLPRPPHDGRRRQGADAQHAARGRDRRAGYGLQRGVRRVRGRSPFKEASKSYKIGDRLELIVPHCDPVVNLYDQMYATRKDRVEAVWPVTARGRVAVRGGLSPR